MYKKFGRFVYSSSLIVYNSGAIFGFFWFHKDIQKFANESENVSQFRKYLISIEDHIVIGHQMGVLFLVSPIIFMLRGESFEDTIKKTKFPFYIKV